MPFSDLTLYGNTAVMWLAALAVAAATFFGLKLVQAVLIRRLVRLAERTTSAIDDVVVGVLRRTSALFLAAVAFFAGSRLLTLDAGADEMAAVVATLALVLQAGVWATVAVDHLLRRQTERYMDEDAATATTLRFVGFLARLLLWLVVLLVALDNLGIDITALVAGLGIGGIAVALAVQNVLGDLLASLSIVLDKPFVIGDLIIVDDMMGTVEHIGLKTTRVRSISGEQLVFSNNDLLSSRIRNYKRMFERRVVFQIGVVYGTPPDRVESIPELIREAVEAEEKARFDRAHFKEFGASSLDFEVVYYVLDQDYNLYMDIQQAINLTLYRRFEELGIEFAFPTRTVHIESVPAGAAAAVAAGGSAGGVMPGE